jgi:uncharacterized protein (UPF0548 family)
MLLFKPSPERVIDFLQRRKASPLSYDFSGATRTIPNSPTPAGFLVDHRREVIGQGDVAWERAKEAIDRWIMFDNGWTTLHAPEGPPRNGNLVAMQVWIAGFWWLNPCRVIYEIDEILPIKRYGFGYGTLLDHAERGEERFLVEQDAVGNVWYDLASFSRPRQLFARVFYPLARHIQLKFGPDSMRAMRRFTSPPEPSG